jgi:hypothetical protein
MIVDSRRDLARGLQNHGTEEPLSKGRLHMKRLLLLAPVVSLIAACAEQGTRPAAGKETGLTAEAEQVIRLVPRSQWRRLNPHGPFLVSPKWNSRGDGLLAAGGMGRGRYLLEPHRAGVVVLDERFRGPSAWVDDGKRVCLERDGNTRTIDYDVPNRRFVEGRNARCRPRNWVDDLGRVIHQDGAKQVFHHPRFGTIIVREGNAPTRMLEDRGAWGARISPDGRRVAYCLGTLSRPELYVVDMSGRITRVGRGAHPAWIPGGRFVVYATVDRILRIGRRATVAESELWAFDVIAGTSIALTSTPDKAEMNPAVSPRGDAVAFSDWRTGAVYVAPLIGRGQP